ncbi:ATP-dependent helicase [Candidatus Saccharibacteria bacterium]|nr:ATP-dependent helicase [Candidatus Saccharibacteria bacterium]
MRLNERQRQAVEYLDGPLLVLAGPGTGKTQLLSEKVAYILQNTDTNPDNILCLTFTETGANNMRERLKITIGNDAMKVNINTYHAFGSDILFQYKNYSDVYDRNLDSAIDEVTRYKVVKGIQNDLNGRDILKGDAVKDIVSVISAAKSAGLSSNDLSKIANQNIEDSQVLSDAISPLLNEIVPRNYKFSYENAYLPIYELLKNYEDTKPILKKVERNINLLAKDLKTAICQAESEQKIKPLSEWKDNYFEKGPRGNYLLKDRVANKKLLSIANVMSKYDDALHKNGWFDFDDMIQEALKVLQADAGFKATLSERYQFIMLDEFQDTNPSQFAIIKELTDYEKPLIMAVGDDDQAIYEFQGALSTNLSDFQKHYEANVISLVDNYRSTQEILDLSRKIINEAPDRFADKELISHKKSPEKTQIYRHEFLSSDMEYGFVAKKIAELIKKGVSQDQIAVISYKTKYFMPLLPYLKAYPEIKIAYEKKDNLLEDEKIHEILTISRFVYELANNQRSTVSILEILSYPFFDLPMLEVVKLVQKAREDKKAVFDLMMETDDLKIKQVAEFLTGLVAKSFNEPFEVFLDYVIGALELNNYRSTFLSYYTKNDFEAFSLYENIASLRGLMKRHFGEKSLKLIDLISLLDDYEAADMPLNTTSPYRDADNAVSILSAHKAKGLEFEHVFIISADHMAWGKGKGNNNLLSLPKNLTFIRHTGMTDGERLRVLYVALTRAKDSIYITNALHDFNGKSPDRLEYLEEYADGDDVISPMIGKVNLHYEIDSLPAIEKNLKNWLDPYIKLTPDMQTLYLERSQKWRMSASALTDFIDIAYAGPVRFFERFILRAPQPPENEALAYGDLLHKVFEKCTKENLDCEKALQYFLDELEKKDLPTDVLKDIREKRPEDLLTALNGFKDIIYNGKAEVDLASEKISLNDVPITGKIDHIIIDDHAKTIEIYDYKTGNYHKENWRSHMTLYRYMLQLEFYKLLLNNSPTYAKYKITKGHILFVTPDKDGEVYDKVYEYNSEDEKELLGLINAVYKLVVSLDFMKDKDIFLMPNQNLGIKDIKNFVLLLLAKNNK